MADDLADPSVRDRLERLAALGGRAAEVAHELRNALSVLETSLYLVRRALETTPALDPKVPQQIERMREQVHAGQRIVREVLEEARDSVLDIGPVDLRTLIVDATTGVPCPEGVDLTLETSSDVVTVDARQIRQLLVNLVRNAFEAVAAAASNGASATVKVSAHVRDDVLTIDVEDDGPGISAAVAPRLFQAFATDRRGGTGLGLTVCKRIVDAHHGTLEASSRAPRGTRMRALLPMMPSTVRSLIRA